MLGYEYPDSYLGRWVGRQVVDAVDLKDTETMCTRKLEPRCLGRYISRRMDTYLYCLNSKLK